MKSGRREQLSFPTEESTEGKEEAKGGKEDALVSY
jgi:hypothetical protein